MSVGVNREQDRELSQSTNMGLCLPRLSAKEKSEPWKGSGSIKGPANSNLGGLPY